MRPEETSPRPGLSRRVLAALLDILFPPVCPLCEEDLAGSAGEDTPLCTSCAASFDESRLAAECCVICGDPFRTPTPTPGGSGEKGGPSGPEKTADRACGPCLKTPPPFESARSVYLYRDMVLEAVHGLKYSGRTILGPALGSLLEDTARDGFRSPPDVVVPVPLHPGRLRKRGYNHSLLMARELSRRLSVPLDYRNLKRARHTEPQVNLSHAERMNNLRGAFEVTSARAFGSKRVLLVDDVYTTGATASECARALRSGGARVSVLTLARAAKVW